MKIYKNKVILETEKEKRLHKPFCNKSLNLFLDFIDLGWEMENLSQETPERIEAWRIHEDFVNSPVILENLDQSEVDEWRKRKEELDHEEEDKIDKS